MQKNPTHIINTTVSPRQTNFSHGPWAAKFYPFVQLLATQQLLVTLGVSSKRVSVEKGHTLFEQVCVAKWCTKLSEQRTYSTSSIYRLNMEI